MDISWASTLSDKASLAVDSGKPHEALGVYERAVRQGASDPVTLANYGVLLWRHFQFRNGEEIFRRVIEDPSTDSASLQRLAHCYFEIGRFGSAAEMMRLAVSRLPAPSAAAINTLAWTLERDNQIDVARHYAEIAIAIDERYGPAARLLAHLDRRAGDFDRAKWRLSQQLGKHPSEFDWGLRYELAAVCDRRGEFEEAWNSLLQAKAQLAPQAANHLRDSYVIRQRQWEVTQLVTAADLRRWRQAGDSLRPPKRIAVLTGFPRSGTTLLEQIIASNDEALDTDESGILPRQFIEPLVWKAEDAMSAIIEIRSFDIPQLTAGREAFYEMTESYLGQPIAQRLLIEKNPLLTADLALALRLFPEASFLVALRDPRDVVLSYFFTMVPLNWSSAPAIDIAEACRFYADTMRHWLWWRSRLEWAFREIRYEKIIDNPVDETTEVAEFLGLQWHSSMLDERRRSERRAVRTPTYDDVAKPLYKRAIGRWENYEEYFEASLKILRPYLIELGYAA